MVILTGTRTIEGLHGLAYSGPANWAVKGTKASPTTTFPQAIAFAQMWDPELLQGVAGWEATEARYLAQNKRLGTSGLIVFAPNADLGRDIRWGRTEECFGEDAFLNAAMVTAYVKGLQSNNPVYWKTASLMKHFLANSNENNTTSIDQLPPILDYDIRKGRTYMYDRNTPLFPFRYGLTYTSFKYSGLKVEKKVLGEDEIIKITFNIQNTGTYDSEEVAQLYVNYPYSKVERPLKAFKGFKRIFIKKGEIAKVSIPLKVADLTF